MRAFNNDSKLRDTVISRVKGFAAAGKIARFHPIPARDEDGSIVKLDIVDSLTNCDRDRFLPDTCGLPLTTVAAALAIHHGLHADEAAGWPVEFVESIAVGSDPGIAPFAVASHILETYVVPHFDEDMLPTIAQHRAFWAGKSVIRDALVAEAAASRIDAMACLRAQLLNQARLVAMPGDEDHSRLIDRVWLTTHTLTAIYCGEADSALVHLVAAAMFGDRSLHAYTLWAEVRRKFVEALKAAEPEDDEAELAVVSADDVEDDDDDN